MSIVYKKEGVGKALFTTSFLTDFIPGVVMSFLFGQLALLAAPIKLSGGYSDGSYSKKALKTQKERLIIFERQSRKIKDWTENHIISYRKTIHGNNKKARYHLGSHRVFGPYLQIVLMKSFFDYLRHFCETK